MEKTTQTEVDTSTCVLISLRRCRCLDDGNAMELMQIVREFSLLFFFLLLLFFDLVSCKTYHE